MKQTCDEVILALYTRLSQIQTAVAAITPEMATLSHSEAEQFAGEGKLKNFVAGIRVLHAIATLQLKNIEVAVDREDDHHSIDFEAIKRELAQIRRQFETSHTSLVLLLNARSPNAFDPEIPAIDCETDGIEQREHAASLETLLKAILEGSNELTCHLCN